MNHKEDNLPFRNVRAQIKSKMEEIARKGPELELEKQLYIKQGERRANEAQIASTKGD